MSLKSLQLPKIVLILLLIASWLPFVPAPAVQAVDAYDTVRTKWFDLLTGGTYNPADTDIATQITSVTSTAQTLWNSLNKTTGRTYLFPDAPSQYPNQNITTSYEHLRDMAKAYATTGSALYHNTNLITDIAAGLDWLYTNWYNESTSYGTQSAENNWFAWEIGAPWALEDTMALVYDSLTAAQITNYVKAIEHWVVTPNDIGTSMGARWGNTGANRSWKSLVWANAGILKKDAVIISTARDALSPNFLYTTTGDGFYEDGSFIQHGAFAYTSGYGFGHLGSTIDLMYLLNGSTWSITDPNSSVVKNWIYDSFEPLIYKNRMFDHLNGRTITRGGGADGASSLIMMSYKLSQMLTGSDAARLKSLLKYLVTSDTTFSYSKFNIFSITSIKSVVNDSAVNARGDLTQYKQFPMMDRFSLQRPGYAFSTGMYSNRINNYESINNENLMGWHTDDGRSILYNGDLTQYSDYFWATVDKYRLPGTTVEAFTGSDVYSPQIGQVTLTTNGTPLVDPLTDWSLTYDHTSGFVFDTAGTIDGDSSRLKRSFDTIESVKYNYPNLSTFAANVYYIQNKAVDGKVKAMASPDGTNWSAISVSLGAPTTVGSSWYKTIVTPTNTLPVGTNYIQLEFWMNDSLPSSTSDQSWTGGTELEGVYGTSGMQLHPQGETLNAKKSWFMFDNEIVSLGSGIRASDGVNVESIVDNRKLNSSGNNALTVNGTAKSNALGWSESMSGVNWMHLAGNVAGSDVGYYFPGGASVKGLREARSGALSDMTHSTNVDTTTYTRNYMTLWYDHGVDPGTGTNPLGSYAYVLLPNMTASQVSAYATSPNISVLENSDDAQGVKENTLNITGVNFWKDQMKKVGIIQANRKSSIMTRELAGNKLEVSISDPTMENHGTIDVEISKSTTTGFTADPGITVYQTSPTIRFTVNVDGAKGKTFNAEFNLSSTPWTPQPPAPSPTPGPVTITDDLNNWSQTWSHSANWMIDTANGSSMEGDPARAKRTSNTSENIVYAVDNLVDFNIKTYYLNGISGKVSVSRSDDGVSWSPVTITNDTPVATGNNWYRTNIKPGAKLPYTTKYLKITVANDTAIYSPQVAQVQLTRSPIAIYVTDEFNDWNTAFAHSTGWYFDSGNAGTIFEGDLSRLKRSVDTSEYVTYHYQNVKDFSSKVYYYGAVDGKITAYTSPDNSTWTAVAVTHDTPVATSGGWYRTNFTTASGFPAGTNYFKLVVANDTRIYTPQIGSIKLELGQFIDGLDGWNYSLSHTSNLTFDTANTSFFNGDTSRVKRTTDTPESMIYNYPNVSGVSLKVYAIGSVDGKVNAYTSSDGAVWTALSLQHDTPVATSGGWLVTNYTQAVSLPVGTNYLKLEVTSDSRIYAPQIGGITFTR